MHKCLTLTNKVEEISRLSEYLEQACEEMGLGADTAMSINLAMEEAVVNVIDYAYPAGTQGLIDIGTDTDGGYAVFTISDSGQPFDPTARETPDISLTAEDRPIGGLGIHLMRQLMDDVSYQRTDGKNMLTLKKNLKS